MTARTCGACEAIVPDGLPRCLECGRPLSWWARARKPSGWFLITGGLVAALAAFWLLVGVDRVRTLLDAVTAAFG